VRRQRRGSVLPVNSADPRRKEGFDKRVFSLVGRARRLSLSLWRSRPSSGPLSFAFGFTDVNERHFGMGFGKSFADLQKMISQPH
jgi:hypothetical protein